MPELVVPVGLVVEPVVPLAPEAPLVPEVCAATTGLSIRPKTNAQFRNSFTLALLSKAPHQCGVLYGNSAALRRIARNPLACRVVGDARKAI